MKLFKRICKWLGIGLAVGALCFISHTAGMAKANDRTFVEEFKDRFTVEQTVETPEDETTEDEVVTPEIDDEAATGPADSIVVE